MLQKEIDRERERERERDRIFLSVFLSASRGHVSYCNLLFLHGGGQHGV